MELRACDTSDPNSPKSFQRVLSVIGVADAIHIAVYYIGTVLLEYQDRTGVKESMYNQRGGGQPRSPVQHTSPSLGPDASAQQFWIPNDLVGSSKLIQGWVPLDKR
jgi:poly(rC)-binding protein 2/3/4